MIGLRKASTYSIRVLLRLVRFGFEYFNLREIAGDCQVTKMIASKCKKHQFGIVLEANEKIQLRLMKKVKRLCESKCVPVALH